MLRADSLPRLAERVSTVQPTLGRRVRDMSLLWLGFAVTVGPSTAPAEHGVIGLVAGALAGLIILVPVGVLLGLLGAGWKQTLCGALGGLLLGAAIGFLGGHTDAVRRAGTGLLTGALVGATLPAMLYRMRALGQTLAALLVRDARAVGVR